jgi:hypothetical protein
LFSYIFPLVLFPTSYFFPPNDIGGYFPPPLPHGERHFPIYNPCPMKQYEAMKQYEDKQDRRLKLRGILRQGIFSILVIDGVGF